MICLVWGPSASGKSAWAEARACELARGAAGGRKAREAAPVNGVRPAPDETDAYAPARLAYFATMQRGGREAQARIDKHLAQRAGKEFVTYETPVLSALADALIDASATVLLDDLGNLVANEMFGAETPNAGAEELARRICASLLGLAGRVRHLVVVADAVGEAGWRGGGPTLAWIECCETCCCLLANAADEVVEVRGGIAQTVKPTHSARLEQATTETFTNPPTHPSTRKAAPCDTR